MIESITHIYVKWGKLFAEKCTKVLAIYNILMIPTEWLSKKLKIQSKKLPKRLRPGFVWFALTGSVALMFFSKKVLHKNIPILLIWLVISVLVTLRYKSAVFHNLICPFGALQKVFGRFAIFSKRVKEDKCTGCRVCTKVCPTEAIEVKLGKAEIEKSLCLQCTNCTQACPKDAICYVK